MPTTFTRTKTETHCEPCLHHKKTSAFYGSDHSWQDYDCTHPDVWKDLTQTDLTPAQKVVLDQLNALTKHEGRRIGRTEVQPSWCPLRQTFK